MKKLTIELISMERKNFTTKIIFLFIVIGILGNNSVFSQNKELKKIKNSYEICESMDVLNNYLLNNFDEEYYRNTGIGAFGKYNNIAIMAGSRNIPVNLNRIFKEIYFELKDKDIDFKNINYIMVADYKFDRGKYGGHAIFISGENFEKYLNDFEKIKKAAIFLNNTYEYSEDPNVRPILNYFRESSVFQRNWGHSKIDKTFEERLEICYKKAIKSK